MKPDSLTRDSTVSHPGAQPPSAVSAPTPGDDGRLEGRRVSHRFGDRWALRDVAFSARQGEFVALFGPNGSGKSTLLRTLAGLITPTRGEVTLRGTPLSRLGRRQLAQRVGFLPQVRPALRHVTVRELVTRGRHPHQRFGWVESREDRDHVDWALAILGLEPFADRDVAGLSGGELQRAWLGVVVAQDPQIVLLDEPVTFLDLRHQWSLLEFLHDLSALRGTTIVAVFHDVNHGLAVADTAYLMHEGHVVRHGHPNDVVTGSSIADVFGIFADVWRSRDGRSAFVVPDGCRSCRRHVRQGFGPERDARS